MRNVFPVFALALLLGPGAGSSGAADSQKPGPSKSAAPDTARVHVGPAGTGTEAFVAWPPGTAAAPGVVVLHEWWGLDAHVRQVARRLASQGYVVIVPDLYRGQLADDPERARALKSALRDDDALALAGEAAAWLRTEPRCEGARVAVLGFCMGGALAERYALRDRDLSAAVMFYGDPETDPRKLAALAAPLQGHFGAEDAGIPQSKVEALRAGLEQAGRTAEIHVYPGAGHAFMHDGRDSYRPDAARQAWARTLAFLQRSLKGPAR